MPLGDVPLSNEAITFVNETGAGKILFVCEHASNFIPAEYDDLGLEKEALVSHIAWDPGALDLAKELSLDLDSPVAAATVSRLVYDLNRPETSPTAMPETGERWRIKGNEGLSPEERKKRGELYYQPFHRAVAQMLDQRDIKALVTIHSFTPVFHDAKREVEIGVLHDSDSRFADLILKAAEKDSQFIVRRNEPYGQQDGVTHTLQKHALPRNLPNVMFEIRNDLLEEKSRQNVRELLSKILADSFGKMSS